MNTQHSDKTTGRQGTTNIPAAHAGNGNTLALPDNRPQAAIQRRQVQGMQAKTGQLTIQKKANSTGLPDQLKSGVENLSGISMDDVKVHYNSAQPKQLQAHAYAQGTDIHVAPGQEKHLAHEAWHVVQQKQGRVRPTMQMKSKVNINDDKGLESEADVMGQKALTQRFALGQDDTVQRAVQHMQRNKVRQLVQNTYGAGTAPGSRTNGAAVAQLWEWGDLFDNKLTKSLPGLFVITEGGLSLATAGVFFATTPLLGISPLIVGVSKLVRGSIMIYNVLYDEKNDEVNAQRKKRVDVLRALEAVASLASTAESLITAPGSWSEKIPQLTTFIAAAIKGLRSFLHFLESKGTPGLSIFLQALETLEGILITVGGSFGLEKNKDIGGLNIGIGASKTARGVIAGGVAVTKKVRMGNQGGNVDIEHGSPVPGDQESFLGTQVVNPTEKSRLILDNK